MKKAAISLGATLVVLTWCVAVSSSLFFGEGSPGQPVIAQDGWPAGLVDLLTRGGRVYSSSFGWIGGDEDCFYFGGDTDDFNWFVEQWAQLKGVSRVLGLHPGREQATGIMTKQPVAWFDWKVTITRHWATPKRNVVIGLDLWVGGQVELKKLKVPLSLEVRAAGQGEQFEEIEKFIVDHEAKRKKAEEKQSPPAGESETEKPDSKQSGSPASGVPPRGCAAEIGSDTRPLPDLVKNPIEMNTDEGQLSQ